MSDGGGCMMVEVVLHLNRTDLFWPKSDFLSNGTSFLTKIQLIPSTEFAPHGMFCARALQAWGALLGYYFMSRNDPERPYLLTSASMEVIGCIKVY